MVHSAILPLFSKHSEIVFPNRKLSTDRFLLFVFAHAQVNQFFLQYIFQPGQNQNYLKRRKFIKKKYYVTIKTQEL